MKTEYQLGDRVISIHSNRPKVIVSIFPDHLATNYVLYDEEGDYFIWGTYLSIRPADSEKPGDPNLVSLLEMCEEVLLNQDDYTYEEFYNFVYAALEAAK